MSNIQKNYLKKRWIYFWKQMGVSLTFLIGIIGGTLGFLNFKEIINLNLQESIIFLLLIIILCSFYSIYKTITQLNNEPLSITIEDYTDSTRPELQDELFKIVKKYHLNNDHREVVMLCSHLSRALWISGKYKQRIILGNFYEDSAHRIEDYDEQVSALIDDLGWTNAVIGEITQAKENINKGIKIAEKNSNNYSIAKAYRHLGTIELRYNKNIDEAITHFENSLKIGQHITDISKNEEMTANVSYNISEAHLLNKDFTKSLQYAETAKSLFIKLKDKTRIIKVKSLIARIFTARNEDNDIDNAKEVITQALSEARKEKRTDEIGKCLLCLGEIQILSDKKELATNTLNEALKIFTSLGSIEEINATNLLIIQAKSKTLK